MIFRYSAKDGYIYIAADTLAEAEQILESAFSLRSPGVWEPFKTFSEAEAAA